jgi:hypothetical protein
MFPKNNSMRNQTQDNTARTRFDTVLPEEARREFFPLKRTPVPPPPVKTPNPWIPTLLMGAFTILCLVILCSFRPQSHPAPVVAPAAAPVVQPTPKEPEAIRVNPIPTPAPVVQPTPVPLPPAVIAPVYRARLVRLPVPVPRAELVRTPWVQLSEAHVDETHPLTMPYGSKVYATLRGFLDSIDQLPRIGQTGDMYVVRTTPWIWTTVPATFAPTWVDP